MPESKGIIAGVTKLRGEVAPIPEEVAQHLKDVEYYTKQGWVAMEEVTSGVIKGGYRLLFGRMLAGISVGALLAAEPFTYVWRAMSGIVEMALSSIMRPFVGPVSSLINFFVDMGEKINDAVREVRQAQGERGATSVGDDVRRDVAAMLSAGTVISQSILVDFPPVLFEFVKSTLGTLKDWAWKAAKEIFGIEAETPLDVIWRRQAAKMILRAAEWTYKAIRSAWLRATELLKRGKEAGVRMYRAIKKQIDHARNVVPKSLHEALRNAKDVSKSAKNASKSAVMGAWWAIETSYELIGSVVEDVLGRVGTSSTESAIRGAYRVVRGGLVRAARGAWGLGAAGTMFLAGRISDAVQALRSMGKMFTLKNLTATFKNLAQGIGRFIGDLMFGGALYYQRYMTRYGVKTAAQAARAATKRKLMRRIGQNAGMSKLGKRLIGLSLVADSAFLAKDIHDIYFENEGDEEAMPWAKPDFLETTFEAGILGLDTAFFSTSLVTAISTGGGPLGKMAGAAVAPIVFLTSGIGGAMAHYINTYFDYYFNVHSGNVVGGGGWLPQVPIGIGLPLLTLDFRSEAERRRDHFIDVAKNHHKEAANPSTIKEKVKENLDFLGDIPDDKIRVIDNGVHFNWNTNGRYALMEQEIPGSELRGGRKVTAPTWTATQGD